VINEQVVKEKKYLSAVLEKIMQVCSKDLGVD